ncbi:MAG: hypothetical protein Q4D26_00265 [Clostridia bacterium]|nr:hypothetical protein [Clostridia bacterium]
MWNKYYGTPKVDISDDFINVGDKIETYKISYYGDGEDFMIGSEDSGIKIYKVSVVPRVNKIIDYKIWDISNNSSFALGEYKNNIIEGMEIINATVESNTNTGNKKAIHIKSRAYGDAGGGKIKINVSDSSGKRGVAVKRTITIKASSKLNGMKVILISSDDFIIGSADLTTTPADYKFDYTGSYDSIYVYSYYSHNCSSEGAYIYSIDNGDSGPIGPEDMEKTISVVRNQSYRYFMTCNNIHNVSAMKYTIVYNPDALRITKIGENPNHIYTTGTYVNYDPSITIISNVEGVLSFKISSDNKEWSGILCPVEFTAKSTGSTRVQITAEVIS